MTGTCMCGCPKRSGDFEGMCGCPAQDVCPCLPGCSYCDDRNVPAPWAATDPQTAADAAEDYIARAIAMLREWFVIAEPSDDEAIVDVPAVVIDAAVAALEQAADDCARMATELEQARRAVATPILRQAWRNGWSDRARAVRDAVRVSDNERDAYERAFARYMSEDPAEADKDPYRPLDGPDDPAALPTRPADSTTGAGDKRTPEQWGAEYDIQIADPDGWRNPGDPAWDEPITLPEYLQRAARSTSRSVTPDVWNRLSRDAHRAVEAEKAAVRPAGGTTDPAESQRTHTGANGPQRSAQDDETDGGNCGE